MATSARRTICGSEDHQQPTLVGNGNRDIMIPTCNSFTLSQHISNAQLIIDPDSDHASQFQYFDLFLLHARTFIDGVHPI